MQRVGFKQDMGMSVPLAKGERALHSMLVTRHAAYAHRRGPPIDTKGPDKFDALNSVRMHVTRKDVGMSLAVG